MLKLYPYKMKSASGTSLARTLGCLKVYPDRQYKPKDNHLIINWGNSTRPIWWNNPADFHMLNHWKDVTIATDKRETFNKFLLHGVPHPEWTDDTDCAQSWIDEGFRIYGRKTLTGHSGRGIIIMENETITSDKICPLYTKATKANVEFRIHIGKSRFVI